MEKSNKELLELWESKSDLELLEIIKKETTRIGSTRRNVYIKQKKSEAPTISYLRKRLGSWQDCIGKIYNNKKISMQTERKMFDLLSTETLMVIVMSELIRLNTSSRSVYSKGHLQNTPSPEYILRRFNSWNEFLQELDVKLAFKEERRKKLGKVIQERLHKKGDFSIEGYEAVRGKDLPTISEIRTLYGSWTKCLEYMQLPTEMLTPEYESWSDEELFSKVAEEIKRTRAVKTKDYSMLASSNLPTKLYIVNRYGGWKAFMNILCEKDPELLEVVAQSNTLESKKIRACIALEKLKQNNKGSR